MKLEMEMKELQDAEDEARKKLEDQEKRAKY